MTLAASAQHDAPERIRPERSDRVFMCNPRCVFQSNRQVPAQEDVPSHGRSGGDRAQTSDRQNPPLRPGRKFVAQTEYTVPRPSPGPRQERPDAGRSPGSRVIARCTAFPGLAGVSVRPSGCDRHPWPAAICIALTAHSCRDSLGFRGSTPPPRSLLSLFRSTNAILSPGRGRAGNYGLSNRIARNS